MSAFPGSDGSVTIPFVPDRSAIDAYLAEIRKGVDMPIRAQYVGPGTAPGSGLNAASIATSSGGPATFSNPAGRNAFVGPGGMPSSMFTASAAGGYGYGGIPMSQASQGGQQMTDAARQLSNVAGQLGQVVQRLGSFASGTRAGPAGPESFLPPPSLADLEGAAAQANVAGMGAAMNENAMATLAGGLGRGAGGGLVQRGRGLLRGLGGFGRYFGIGYGVHEVLGQVSGYLNREHEAEMGQLMGATPQDHARMRLNQLEQIRSGGVFGLNPIIQGGMNLLAGVGINPFGMFTRLPDAEREQAGLIQAYSQRDFLSATYRQERGMLGQIELAGTRGGFARQRAELRQTGAARQLDIATRFGMEHERYNRENDPTGSYRDWLDRMESEMFGVSMRASDASMRGIDRSVGLTRRNFRNDIEAATLAAQGKFGEASQRALFNRLQMDAYTADPELQPEAYQRANREWEANQARVNFNAQRYSGMANVTYDLYQHNPLKAQLDQMQLEKKRDLSEAANNRERFQISAYYNQQEQFARQSFGEEGSMGLSRINARTEVLNLQSGLDPRSAGQAPGMRRALAEVAGVVSGYGQQMEQARNAGRVDWIPAIQRQGIAALQNFQAAMNEGSAQEASPFGVMRQGQPGSADTSTYQRTIADGIIALNKKVDELIQTAKSSGSGDGN